MLRFFFRRNKEYFANDSFLTTNCTKNYPAYFLSTNNQPSIAYPSRDQRWHHFAEHK